MRQVLYEQGCDLRDYDDWSILNRRESRLLGILAPSEGLSPDSREHSKMLMLQELQTRILNIRYVLKHPSLSEVQRARFLHLLGSAETELLGIYESGHL